MDVTACLLERAAASGLQLGGTQEGALRVLGQLRVGPATGVYLHGPAGRGKTWLLDAVAACGGNGVRRYHWSEFFTRLDAEVGRRLTDPDRLPRALDEVVGPCDVLCFDEVQVTDPDDAGLVEHLLRRLHARGTRVVATSNQAPHELLPDPHWHHWARGLIRLLEEQYVVCRVDDGTDYRVLGGGTRFAGGRLLPTPYSPGAGTPAALVSGGRALPVVRHADELWARFRTLLGSPTGRQDYLLMCREQRTLGLLDVPALHLVDDDTRTRFALLVDIAYDTDTRLLLVMDGPADWSLLPPRTASRLQMLRRAEPLG